MNQNHLKKIASLAHSKYRKIHGLFLVEGLHPVQELLKARWPVDSLLITYESQETPEISSLLSLVSESKIEILNQKVFEKLVTTETPQGIMAVAQLPGINQKQIVSQKRILIADGIADPGNIGTILRSAAAFGFDAFATTVGSADIYSPKAVRASQGALFMLKTFSHAQSEDLINSLKGSHSIIALTANSKTDLREIKKSSKIALVVGAEIAGVSPLFLKAADFRVMIPMPGMVESLNASTAASIAMYELSRILS